MFADKLALLKCLYILYISIYFNHCSADQDKEVTEEKINAENPKPYALHVKIKTHPCKMPTAFAIKKNTCNFYE